MNPPPSRLVLAVLAFAFIVIALVVIALVGAIRAQGPEPPGATAQATPASASPSAGSDTPTQPTACTPTDQDKYVYHPSRLVVRAACIHVTGTVKAVHRETDGDLHILLALDPAYVNVLTPANQGVALGDLVVEPVCVRSVVQADALATCARDPDPIADPFPVVGQAVWMEGRYVLDLEHAGWAELHPLYRWADKYSPR